MRKITLLISLFFATFALMGQRESFSRIEMKNGTRWVGTLVEVNDTAYFLEISGGSILMLPRKDIVLISVGSKRKVLGADRPPVRIDQSGAFVKIKFDLFPGTGRYANLANSTLSGLSLQYGYKINRFVQPALVSGVLFPSSNNSPLYGIKAHFEGEILKRSTAPYYYASAGYYFSGNARADERFSEKGGLNLEAGLGLKFYTERGRRWVFELGYMHQRMEELYDYRPWGSIENRYYRLHRMAFSLGLEF